MLALMPDLRRRNCRECGKHEQLVGPISWGGLCHECGLANLTDNVVGLATHSGEPFRRWREGMARSVGATLPPTSAAQTA